MSGVIVLGDNADWIVAGWVYDNVLAYIAEELEPSRRELAQLLLNSRTGVALGYCDLSGLDAGQFQSLAQAAARALSAVKKRGPSAFHYPSFYPGFVDRFEELRRLLEGDARLTTRPR
ncbi:hypothetical protein [Chondromyces crocatus]|uniref:Uncharacterized protein n=1 Tax=Chondromyces crocatus TaxID=52 RepID=A0A0K1ECE0_CHOCO|nr:hypothetical protein [Chondromyces crocatus]AKT38519.1 uncharacterized protein CMC5_026660 [Chondromyces crocatus]